MTAEIVRVLTGELRTDLASLFSSVPHMNVLLTVPGLLDLPPTAALRAIARNPSQPVTAHDAHAWLRAFLEAFSQQVDELPQTREWARLLDQFGSRLASQMWEVRFYGRTPTYERLICREEASVLVHGPLTGGILARASSETLVPELRGDAHRRAVHFFDSRWELGDDVSEHVRRLIVESWAGGNVDPADLYYKVALEYFEDMLADPSEEDDNPLLEVMADFQVRAYQTAKGMLRRYGGVLLSDVVGLGKTYIGLALVKHLQSRYGQHAVVVGPPAVCAAWRDLATHHRIELPTVSHGKLSDLSRFSDREVLVVDESHNFRNGDTARYQAIQDWLRSEQGVSHRRVILISATPQNNRAKDVMRQLQLFPDGFSRLPFVGENLESYFRDVEQGRASLREVLQHVVVRRTRRFIRAQYPDARIRLRNEHGVLEWTGLRFPERLAGPEQCLRYVIDDMYPGGLYQQIIDALAGLSYPLYGLAAYLRPGFEDDPRLSGVSRSGVSLRGLFKALLLKRLESSIFAFKQTLRRLCDRLMEALERLREGVVVVRQRPASRSTADDAGDLEATERSVESRAFYEVRLERDLVNDLRDVSHLLAGVAGVGDDDAKLTRLQEALIVRPPSAHKTVVFTQFAETADYLAKHLGQMFGTTACHTGGSGSAVGLLRRFAPRAQNVDIPESQQIRLLISTDALSEGVNLQDADSLINYDLHWNPIRLIQRAGRIDRIGSPNEQILIASFLPERALERHLGLEEVLRRRIAEFTRVFGEDGDVLPSDERLDVAEVAEAYDGQALESNDAGEDLDGLAWHAERVLNFRASEPERHARVLGMRDGRRAKSSSGDAAVGALRAGWLWAFYGPSDDGVVTLDHVEALDLLWRHAQAGRGSGVSDAVEAFDFIEAATAAFAREAELLDARRSAPRLSATERWLLDELEGFRAACPPHRRSQFELAYQWIRAAQYGARLRPVAQKWRREHLTGVALLEETLSLARRLPLRDDIIGSPRLVGCVG